MTTTATAIRVMRPRRGATRSAGPWVYLMATILVAICVGPVLYVIIGGFRTNAQITQDPSGWPSPWVFGNYGDVLTSSEFWLAMGNSTISAGVTTIGTVVLGVMASYVIARYDFIGKGAMYSLFAAGLMFPATVAITPLYLLIRNLGASRLGFFWRMVVPLSLPGVITVAILCFVTTWNGYILPLFILSDQSLFTLPLGVQNFASQYSVDTARVLAYTSLSMIPALIFFSLFEKRIVGGLTGAVKG
jgi:raffinose/stachyose/melibiose transport system permease protein